MPQISYGPRKGTRLSKEIWLKHTLFKIGEVGVSAIQVEKLAKDLNVTKGSFYWHFRDRDALLSQTLAYWYASKTEAIGLIGQRNFEDPVDRLRYYFTLALSGRPDVPGGAVERALEEWARFSHDAAQTTRRVNQDRIRLIADAYAELGMSKHQARRIATMALAQIIGMNVLARWNDNHCCTENLEQFLEVFLSAPEKNTIGLAGSKTAGRATLPG